jgi:hypothetical protein
MSSAANTNEKQREVRRITGVLKRLTRDFDSMPPTAKRQLMRRVDIWLEELNRVKARD